MKLGLSSYTFSWAVGVPGRLPARPLDELALLNRCAEHDVRLLQVGDNLPLHEFAPTRLDRFAEQASCGGIQLEIGARRLTRERVREYATIARRVNAQLIRFVIDDTDYHPTPENVTAELAACAPFLDGLTLGLENHDRFRAEQLRTLIERAQNPRIGVCLDTANSLGAGEGIEAVAVLLAPLTVNLHLKDFNIERVPYLMGFAVSGRPAGSGMMDVPGLLRMLAPHQRCHSAVLELWTPPDATLALTIEKEAAWARQSLHFLKPFFN